LKEKSLDLFEIYKRCRNKLTHIKETAKRNHFADVFRDSNNPANTSINYLKKVNRNLPYQTALK